MYDFILTSLFNTDVKTVYNACKDPAVCVKWIASGTLGVSNLFLIIHKAAVTELFCKVLMAFNKR
jgi:hypothetical protein